MGLERRTVTQLITGDCLEVLRGMQEASVHCVITSPPYWSLRNYGDSTVTVWDGKPDCNHEWVSAGRLSTRNRHNDAVFDRPCRAGTLMLNPVAGAFCSLCGAWRGSLGLEPTPDLFVQHLVEGFREVRRVLRADGTCWIVIADSYASGKGTCLNPGGGAKSLEKKRKNAKAYPLNRGNKSSLALVGLKPKDLCGIPWRLALALQADGWWWRATLPWLKRNAMPSSVKDRPTASVEYVLMMTKSATYYFDMQAVKLPAVCDRLRGTHGWSHVPNGGDNSGLSRRDTDPMRSWRDSDPFFRSWQGLWVEDDEPLAFVVNPEPLKEAHYAAFPRKLVEPMVKAGTSERGCCPAMLKRLRLRSNLTAEERKIVMGWLRKRGLLDVQ